MGDLSQQHHQSVWLMLLQAEYLPDLLSQQQSYLPTCVGRQALVQPVEVHLERKPNARAQAAAPQNNSLTTDE